MRPIHLNYVPKFKYAHICAGALDLTRKTAYHAMTPVYGAGCACCALLMCPADVPPAVRCCPSVPCCTMLCCIA